VILDNAYEIITDDLYVRVDGVLPDSELFLKIEGLNLAGSIKIKTAVNLITDAENRGILRPGDRVIESSSGSLGIALALVCAGKGYPFTCVSDPNASTHSTALIRALGAEVVIIDERDANGGFLGSRLEYLRKRLEVEDDLVWLNQYTNPANPEVHARCTAASVLREFGYIDYLFVGAGTTGTLMGCAQYFKRFSPHTEIVAVDAVGSVTFGHAAGPRHIPGIGTSRKPELCDPDAVDHVVLIKETDAVRMCRWLARERGLVVGGSTGSVVSAVAQMAVAIPRGKRVVAISPDLGERYLQTVYDDEWVTARFGPDCLLEGYPLPLDGPAQPAGVATTLVGQEGVA
jgi:2,3-diaminopropionate biosynthesis protein SbnA